MIKAKFIGAHGSMGFCYGKVYRLKTKMVNNIIQIEDLMSNLYCPYSSLESFLQNWEILR